MKNNLPYKGFLIFIVATCFFFPSFAAQQQRYLWLSVLYVFNENEKFIAGKEVCEYKSFNNWGSKSSDTAKRRECTYTPDRYIPPKSIEKVLRVHIDCQDKTYDAKGDGKGWRQLQLQENVMKAAIRPCIRSGYNMELLLKGLTSNERQKIFDTNFREIISYKECLQDSLDHIRVEKSQSLRDPVQIGLTLREQVNAYYLRIQSKLPNTCRKVVDASNKGLSKLEIDLTIWDPVKLETIEYVIKSIPNCLRKT